MNALMINKCRNNEKGLTLIEIMIAMLIGILLLLGISSMFMTNKRIYTEQEYMSRLQENARFAMEILMHDIRMAGYSGCVDDVSEVLNHVNGSANDDSLFDFSNSVEGSENGANWQPSGSNEHVGDILANTDGISVRFLDPSGITIDEPMPTTSAELKVTTVGDLEAGEIIAVTDCDSADIMYLTQVQTSSSHLQHNTGTGAPGNATKNLQKKYGPGAGIVRFISRRYTISTGANGQPALFRYHYTQDTDDSDGDSDTTERLYLGEELIEGVDNMQALYGEDTSGDKIADTYVQANNVTSWDNVVSVRIALLFRTVEENNQITPETTSFDLLGGSGNGGYTVPAANDFRRRRMFTTTIQIRNRSI